MHTNREQHRHFAEQFAEHFAEHADHFHHHMPPGPGDRRGGRGRRRGGRALRGDVRTAILQLLLDEPMHGYQIMQAISDRSGGRWVASPGAVYPAISQLEDEGLVTVVAEGGRKLVTLTDEGRAAAEELRQGRPDPFASFTGSSSMPDLRDQMVQVVGAVREVLRSGSDTQVASATEILRSARRSLYLLLAQDVDEEQR
jgi:DNA-binding PadR family transcriptional regulator